MISYFNRAFIIFFLLLANITLYAQTKYQRIATFTKVWGFLKYHHPAVASGKIDWDSVYMVNIPKIEKATSKAQFNNELLSVINNLETLQTSRPAILPDSLFANNHNLKWIDQSTLFTAKVKGKLKEVYTYRNQGNNVFMRPGITNDIYSAEKKYEKMDFPNRNYRLLFLARFWNIINYFSPYKFIIGEDWDHVLNRFIPKFINVNDKLNYYSALLELISSLHDGHAQLILANNQLPINDLVFGKYTAPVYVAIVNNTVVIRKSANDSLCTKANIKKGDIILSVDNVPVTKRIIKLKPYVSASNNAGLYEVMSRILLNTNSVFQKLNIKRGQQIFTVNVHCILAAEKNWGDIQNYTANKTGYKTIGNSIAYVYAMQVWKGNMDTIKSLIKRNKAVIFDGRNYQNNGDVFYKIFDMFLPEPKAINLATIPIVGSPGYFKWISSKKIGRINNSPYNGKVIILVDERAQSQGEYTAMALQTIPNAITIGSQTSGVDGESTPVPINGGLTLSYSGYGVYYPDKTPTQRIGVKIDIPVTKTVESVIKGKDVALETALEYLKSKGID